MNLSLSTAFTEFHRFWVVMFSFSFVSMYILISFLSSSVICWLFSTVLFSLHMLGFFNSFSPVIEINSYCIVVRKDTWNEFNFFEFIKARFMAQDVIYPGEDSVSTEEKGEIHCFGVNVL